MQPYVLEIYISLTFYIIIKLFCLIYVKMYKNNLTSIPERNEFEEEPSQKWVAKKKHEVLKAKYKCLKKLFQIYDANVIGFLPNPNEEYTEEIKPKRRRKRSHRTKTDACAGTELNSDITSEYDQTFTIPNQSEISNHNIDQSTLELSKTESKIESNQSKTDFEIDTQKCLKYSDNIDSKNDINCPHLENIKRHPMPYLIMNERQKLTRFQCFIQRVFGIKRDGYQNENFYSSSDCNARRRRGLRFRRLKRTKKNKSDSDMKDLKSPLILSFVQSVQKNCLMDRTPRQCPMMGCHMVAYGIINYNDHLNLCHLKDRKYICHYCHEGFEREYDKFLHENDHIGINKLNTNMSNLSSERQSSKIASITQTESGNGIPDEKLKKIVSFFDKIQNPEIMELKKNRGSESNIDSTIEYNSTNSGKRTVSCMNLRRTLGKSDCSNSSDVTSKMEFQGVNCRYCGENFNYRRQLSLHVDLEHRAHDKFSKFHSCAGIVSLPSPEGQIDYQSRSNSCINCLTEDTESVGKSDTSLSCDQTTNIVYYSSLESMKKPSTVDSLANKVRSYHWEPGTKIIRV